MNRTGIPYLDFTWNPGGFGCSRGCDGCWAKQLAPRIGRNIGCDDCKHFRVHWHPERLADPASRKKPAVIGVQFTGDLFDRPAMYVYQAFETMQKASQHTYVLLTQLPLAAQYRVNECAHDFGDRMPENWFMGLTVRTQAELETRLFDLLPIPGRKWLSIEPIRSRIDFSACIAGRFIHEIEGVIIGCDNRTNRPFHVSWVRDLVGQCRQAGVAVYVKQLVTDGRLVTNAINYPEDLQRRELPWKPTSMTKGYVL